MRKATVFCLTFLGLAFALGVDFPSPFYSIAEEPPATEALKENPLYFAYMYLIQEKIAQEVTYPEAEAEGYGREAAVKLGLCLLRDGRLKEVSIQESSGSQLLDDLAKTSVKKASPFAPIPASLGLDELYMEVPIVYQQSPVLASQGEGKREEEKLTLEDCIEIALSRHQPAQIAREQITLASLKVNEARRALFPLLIGEYKTSRGQTITDPYKSVSYGVQLEQPVYDGGKLLYTLRRQELGLEMARRNYEKVKNDLEFEVSKAYYELARAITILNNWQELLKEAKTDLELSKKLYEAGLNTQVEFLNVQARYNLISYQVTSARNVVSLAKLAFYQALNVEEEEIPEEDILFKFSSPKELGVTLQQCLDLAKENRPEIRIARDAVSSTKYGKLIAQRESWPKLSLVSSYGRSGEAYASEKLTLINEWSITGKVSWYFGGSAMEYSISEDRTMPKEITDTTVKTEATTHSAKVSVLDKNALAYYSGRKESQITYQQALDELHETNETVEKEVEESFFNYKKGLIGIESATNRIKFRLKNIETLKARFNIGEVGLSDILGARIELAEERAFQLQSLADYHLALVSLNKATGYAIEL